MKRRSLAMRLYLTAYKHHLLAPIIIRINRVINSCDIPATAHIEPSVILLHNALGCVIHERAVIGADTVICQNVTIGGRGQSGAPIIGDNCIIGCGACVLGGVKIGNNARIGANAVVITDVPENYTAVGVPARMIPNNEDHIVK